MSRMFVRGDTHGKFDFLESFCKENKTTKQDILVILGDHGINFINRTINTITKEIIKDLPITLLCIRGNHDKRPEHFGVLLEEQELKVGDFCGKVYYEDEYPNILYSIDGNIFYTFKKRSILIIGGAYSVDKFYRLAQGWTLEKDEVLSKEEMDAIFSQIKDVNFVFTHTCPYEYQPTDLFLNCIDQNTVDSSMEHFFHEINKTINYDYWFFGHYHDNRESDKMIMLFDKIINIEDYFI